MVELAILDLAAEHPVEELIRPDLLVDDVVVVLGIHPRRDLVLRIRDVNSGQVSKQTILSRQYEACSLVSAWIHPGGNTKFTSSGIDDIKESLGRLAGGGGATQALAGQCDHESLLGLLLGLLSGQFPLSKLPLLSSINRHLLHHPRQGR